MKQDYKKCKCCGSRSLPKDSAYYICHVCGWEDDDIQNDNPDFEGGANDMSLNQAIAAYKKAKNNPAKGTK